MTTALATSFWHWVSQLPHPWSGLGYQFWSGLGSDIGQLTLLGLPLLFWRHHNCHVKGCWRMQWHPHPEHGHPVCRRHHPHEVGEEIVRPRQPR